MLIAFLRSYIHKQETEKISIYLMNYEIESKLNIINPTSIGGYNKNVEFVEKKEKLCPSNNRLRRRGPIYLSTKIN